MKARGRITLTKDPRNSKRIIYQEGTTQILGASHVMRKATSQEIVPETKDPPRRTKRRGIMHILQRMLNKRTREYFSSDEEYVLISAFIGTITHGSNDWLVDSGASKHMLGYKESFINLS